MPVRRLRTTAATLATLTLAALALTFTAGTAGAATPPVGLGTAGSYAVLAGSTVTNTGSSVLTGDVGVSPGSAVTGFPPGLINGATHAADAEALQAKNDLTVAYGDAAGRTPVTSVAAELGGNTFLPGVYTGATLELTGSMTLDAGGDADAVFVFKTNSTLITASNSSVNLIGGANLCNVYWQVSSSATLGTGTDFVGTIMAQQSISANSGATVEGRLLALNGAVTLDNNVITRPDCPYLPPGTTTSTTAPEGGSTTTEPEGGTSTTAPEGGSTTTEPEGDTSTTAPEGGSTTTEPEGGTSTTAPEGGSTTASSTPGPGSPTTGPETPGGPRGPNASRTSLARTGSNAKPLAIVGLLTMAAGAGVLVLRRRHLAR